MSTSSYRPTLQADMSNTFRHNHYVPSWYQKRFIPAGQKQKELFCLDLTPKNFVDSQGRERSTKAVRRRGVQQCFAEQDLYTMTFGSNQSTDLEQYFFGEIDSDGRRAVDYFTNFAHPSVDGKAFQDMMMYMSTQKLRTPKGLDWLGRQAKTYDKIRLLATMVRLRQVYCATWTDCIWQIADANHSPTKFIISDHPVTVYNRRCTPGKHWCRASDDPDIRFHATHTVFPLSLEKVLILTNLSWVRNPYQPETRLRPNPSLFHHSIFKFMEIQTLRHLSEQEVQEINFIIKRRAFRYVAAAKEEWLYPEKQIPSLLWHSLGNGYLLMPDPRPVNIGGEIIIGHSDGSASAFDEYGRRPWQEDFSKETKTHSESASLDRFKGEFARLYGPSRRGRSFGFGHLDEERDSDEFHQYHLSLEQKGRRKR